MRFHLQLERSIIEGLGYNLEYSRTGTEYNPAIGFELRNDFTKWGNHLFYGWFADENSRLRDYRFTIQAEIY